MICPAISQTAELPLDVAPHAGARSIPKLALIIGAMSLLLVLALSLAQPIARTGAPSAAPSAVAGAMQTDFSARSSHNGIYRAEVASAPRAIQLGEGATWVFRVERRNHRRLAGADVALQARMVDRGDSTAAALPARYVGAGRYEVRDVRLTEPGWWNLALVIRGVRGTDSLAFNVVIDR